MMSSVGLSSVVCRIATIAMGCALVAVAGMVFAPASGAVVINGCTIITTGGPEPENHTVCPRADLAGVDLSGLQLGYSEFQEANLSKATISGSDLNFAKLTGANLRNANLTDSTAGLSASAGIDMTGANLTRSLWIAADLSGAKLTNAILSGARFENADLSGAELSGSLLIPASQTVPVDNAGAATVTWPTPQALPGTRFLGCDRESGSVFPVGTTTVICQVEAERELGVGRFTVTVTAAPSPGLGSTGFGSSGFGSSGFGLTAR
jgi:hypothetical protein